MKVKNISGIDADEYAEVYPGAITNWKGVPHIGVASAGTASSLTRGIYTYGRIDKNYPNALNMEYTLSTGTQSGTTLQVGSVFADSPTELYIGWRDDASYGIDIVSTTIPFKTAVYTSRVFDDDDPFRRKLFKTAKLVFSRALRVGESVTASYSADRGSFTTLGTFSFASDGAILAGRIGTTNVNAREMPIRFTITSGNTALAIDSFLWEFETERLV